MKDQSVQSIIYSVLKKKSLIDYLEKRGHYPVKTLSGGKSLYLCPFPDHSETKPSFVVYTQSEYENFHCYGCQRHHNIIHLVSELEGIPFKEALSRLSDGMDVNYLEGVDLEMERIDKEYKHSPISLQMSEEMISISNMARLYLQSVENDPNETLIIDQLLDTVDKDVVNANFDGLSETSKLLPLILHKRREKYEHDKIEKMREDAHK